MSSIKRVMITADEATGNFPNELIVKFDSEEKWVHVIIKDKLSGDETAIAISKKDIVKISKDIQDNIKPWELPI